MIYNRMKQGIPLELDSTVLYGLNTFGIIASNTQLQSASPYNTYKHKGLTPGPIDSPGNAAIEAVLHPAPGTGSTSSPSTRRPARPSSPRASSNSSSSAQELEHNLGKK